MHDTAMKFGKLFFDVYIDSAKTQKIADIGAQDVNGSLRKFAKANFEYVGVDFVEGKGVDVVITDPYKLPFPDDTFDAVVCSSCFEHSEFFWLTFMELARVTKPDGLIYLNVPSNGAFHRYPVDCWRFYPDSGRALQNWANRNGMNVAMLESFTGSQEYSMWNDFVAVFVKDKKFAPKHSSRIMDQGIKFTNGLLFGEDNFINYSSVPEDAKSNPLSVILRRLRQRKGRSLDFS